MKTKKKLTNEELEKMYLGLPLLRAKLEGYRKAEEEFMKKVEKLKKSYKDLRKDVLKTIDSDRFSWGEVRNTIDELFSEYIKDFFPEEIPPIKKYGFLPNYDTYWRNFGKKNQLIRKNQNENTNRKTT